MTFSGQIALDIAVDALGIMEVKVNRLEILGQRLPMSTCEDYVNLSFMNEEKASIISDAISSTKVGLVRDHLDHQLNEYMGTRLSRR